MPKITVNGTVFDLDTQHLTYEQAVSLAQTGRTGLHSVTYRRASGPHEDGILHPGESVEVRDGAVINAFITDSA